ncbi:hypothetical protein [Hyphomicrobium sp.]|uniref:hypothetical protein n=1 Tax=Hyphomicrobium sp. TaxID=82 RepID=UPI000FA4B1D5|nr:hypothetical protein [Hyphomicrobium sp.]RUP09045.1 MAG: hypothetical protein EKK38_10395 [Hyphomicrobium sp.]
MSRLMVIAGAMATLAAAAPFPANAGGGGEAAELEAARANARAGGPTNARDAELLHRYGCESGTRSWACGNGRPERHYYSGRYRRY